MKATQFVKKYGWVKAKTHLVIMDVENWHNEFFNNLQNLVNAYELVESYGGLDKANKVVSGGYIDSNHDIPDGHIELSMAIELVESVK